MHVLKKNIYKNYMFTFLNSFELTNGIWLIYLAHKGLTLFEIALMEVVLHVSSFLMEIPTGAIADIYGRKVSRILGRLIKVFSTLVMLYGDHLYVFAVAFILIALSYNLESGAGDALVYDSLKEVEEEDHYKQVRGRNEFFFQTAKTSALFIGGYLALKSYELVYQVSLGIAILGFLQAFTFHEPSIGVVEKKPSFLETFIFQLKASFKVIKEDQLLLLFILTWEVFSTIYVTEFFYMQNHLKSFGYSEFYIGGFLAVGALFAAIVATQSYRFERYIQSEKLVLVLLLCALPLFWGMAIAGVEKYVFILLSGIEGVLFVFLGDLINKRIPSDKRATVLSFQSMLFSFLMILFFPITGKLGDLYNLNMGFAFLAFLGTSFLLPLFIKLQAYSIQKTQ